MCDPAAFQDQNCDQNVPDRGLHSHCDCWLRAARRRSDLRSKLCCQTTRFNPVRFAHRPLKCTFKNHTHKYRRIVTTSQNDAETVDAPPPDQTRLINTLLDAIQAIRSVSGFDLRMFSGCTDTTRIPSVTSWLPETYRRMSEIRFQSAAECRWNQEGLVSIWMHECWSKGGWWSSRGGVGGGHWKRMWSVSLNLLSGLSLKRSPWIHLFLHRGGSAPLLVSWGHVLAKELLVNDR